MKVLKFSVLDVHIQNLYTVFVPSIQTSYLLTTAGLKFEKKKKKKKKKKKYILLPVNVSEKVLDKEANSVDPKQIKHSATSDLGPSRKHTYIILTPLNPIFV